jgi:hypothetical protein
MVYENERAYHPLFAEWEQAAYQKIPDIPAALGDDHTLV